MKLCLNCAHRATVEAWKRILWRQQEAGQKDQLYKRRYPCRLKDASVKLTDSCESWQEIETYGETQLMYFPEVKNP